MRAYTWDEVGMEVQEFDISELDPLVGKISPTKLALLADAIIAADLSEVEAEQADKPVEYGWARMDRVKVEQESGCTVLTGTFGQDKNCCLVINPDDDGMAQHVARRRLHLYEEKDNAEG